jgi:hypothetical protein
MPLLCLLGVKWKSWPQRARSCCDVRHNLRQQRVCFWPWSPYSLSGVWDFWRNLLGILPQSPILHPVSWNDTSIKISTTDTALLGGSDSSHIPYQWASFNYSARSFLLLCVYPGMMALHVWMFNWLLKFPVPLAREMILLNYISILLLRWDFPVIILLINKGHLRAFILVLIWMRSFMELLLSWIVHTQHLLSDPWIGTGQMNISGTGLKDNLCLPMRGIGSQLQDGSHPYGLHLLEWCKRIFDGW